MPLRCRSAALLLGIVAVSYQIATGIGTWGLNKTVGWAFDITNFVFWVGIGHAGTLISAVLFLFRQKWRTAVNRSAEAMTLFAVMCAGIFPLIHMGRPWLAFWMVPYPNTRGPLWVNFKSPLLWDVFAISTYLLISAVFWYIGLLPDLATIRDRRVARLGPANRVDTVPGVGWFGAHVAPIRNGVHVVGRAGDAARLFGSYDCEHGFCHGGHSRLAHDDLSAVLCGGRDFQWIGDGVDADDHRPQGAATGSVHHAWAHRPHVQADVVDGLYRRAGLRHRILHGLLQRQRIRAICIQEPCAGAV